MDCFCTAYVFIYFPLLEELTQQLLRSEGIHCMSQQQCRVRKSACLQGPMVAREVVLEGLEEHCSPRLSSLSGSESAERAAPPFLSSS